MKKVLTSLFYAIVVLLTITSCSPKQVSLADQTAKIVFTLGEVSLNGSTAGQGTEVSIGDTIKTGEKSVARIQIGEKTVIQIKANSELVYRMDENTLELKSGWMSGITQGKLTKKNKYSIKTPTAIAAVRGTAYCLKVESPESTYFCTCNGTIHQHAAGDDSHAEDVSAAHHSARRYIAENGSIKVEEAAMEYHADKDLEEIAAVIGETIDWEKVH